tara:strand:- start:94 stop:360 length:267 start_codon:yes stop_codon:yes gene_type:complete
MTSRRFGKRNLKIGELVYHALYGREWIGVIVGFDKNTSSAGGLSKEKALVQIQPGTKFDGFFDRTAIKTNRVSANLGYVSIHWLFRIK